MIKVYLGLANPSLEISLQSFWFMHGLILAKQWTAEVQSYKYRESIFFWFWSFPAICLGGIPDICLGGSFFSQLSLYTWSNCCSWHSIGGGGGAESPILSYSAWGQKKLYYYWRQQTGERCLKRNFEFEESDLYCRWKRSSLRNSDMEDALPKFKMEKKTN